MDKNSKIYIAGHTGLVGSALHRQLIAREYKDFVFTPFSEYDLRDQQTVARFFSKEKPDYVFLAAAKVGGIVANNTYRADFIYDNLQIQNNIIHQSYVHGVKKLLFLGSSCIYPKLCKQPMKEKYLLTDTLEYTNEPYAIAKIAGLKMCESYNIQYNTNFIAVMPTNLYGENDNFDLEKSHVLPAMIRKIHLAKCLENSDFNLIRKDITKTPIPGLSATSSNHQIIKKLLFYGIEKQKITLWGSGNPRREFLHSNDLANACVFLMQNINFKDIVSITKNPENEIRNVHLNIGTGTDISIKDLAYLIKQIVGFDGTIDWDTSKPDGTTQKLLDVSKLVNLGWKPTVEFEDGIKNVYDSYQQDFA